MKRRQRRIVLEQRDGVWQAPAPVDPWRERILLARFVVGSVIVVGATETEPATKLILTLAGVVVLGWLETPRVRAWVLALALAGPARASHEGNKSALVVVGRA